MFATVAASRRPSEAHAIRYSSRLSWIIWPSPRRASSGGSLKPDPSYSPISSTPPASRSGSPPAVTAGGGAAAGCPVATMWSPGGVLEELPVEHVGVLLRVRRGHQL